jgi:hypothetical protein
VRRAPRLICWLFLAQAIAFNSSYAQQRTLSGRVLAGSQPVPNQFVALHRVTDSGGVTLDTDTTDATGLFELTLDDPKQPGVRFVATSYESKWYIGEPFRESAPASYIVSVGPGATPIELGAATAATATPPPARNRAGLMVLIVSALLFGGILILAVGRQGAPGRQLLVDIADLDNRNEKSPLPNYETQRAELLRRLRESA